jgi:hypothetical protein
VALSSSPLASSPPTHPLPSPTMRHCMTCIQVHRPSIFGANQSVNQPSGPVFGLIPFVFGK